MITVLVFVLTLSVLIGFHEAGHYWMARRCGVRVLRFSIGFGTPIWRRTNREGTEFALAPIPLGGYVKMLDEREGEVAEADRPYAHNRQSPLRRIAIAAAGPAANFLLAVVVFWLVGMLGTTEVRPWTGTPQSAAEWEGQWPEAPAEIVAVDGAAVSDWRDVQLALLERLGDTGEITLRLHGDNGGQEEVRRPVEDWLSRIQDPNPIRALGLIPWQPDRPAVIGEVQPDSPATQAGLEAGDRVLAVNGEPVDGWRDWVGRIQASPGETLTLTVERSSGRQDIDVTPASVSRGDGEAVGQVGVYAPPPENPGQWQRTVRQGPLTAMGAALGEVADTTGLTLSFLGKMLTGQASVQNLSGPVSIAQVAGDSASFGLAAYLSFLGLLSISLGVLNLLPVPVLDGGHILYYLLEMVRGRPLSERTQAIGVQIGLALLLGVMLLAFANDFARF